MREDVIRMPGKSIPGRRARARANVLRPKGAWCVGATPRVSAAGKREGGREEGIVIGSERAREAMQSQSAWGF